MEKLYLFFCQFKFVLFNFSEENSQTFASCNSDSCWICVSNTITTRYYELREHIFVSNGNNFSVTGQTVQRLTFKHHSAHIIIRTLYLLRDPFYKALYIEGVRLLSLKNNNIFWETTKNGKGNFWFPPSFSTDIQSVSYITSRESDKSFKILDFDLNLNFVKFQYLINISLFKNIPHSLKCWSLRVVG